MRKLLLFCCLPFFSSIVAQPSLLHSDLLPIGSVTLYNGVSNLAAIDTTIQGANVTWDFSGLVSDGSDVQFSFLDPASTAQGASFPTANYARAGTNDNYIDYFIRTDDHLDLVGFWSSGGGVVTYTDPQRDMVFPMSLGVTNSDTWANTLSSFGGTYTLEGVGYGSLTLPSGTFNNVVMVRAMQNEIFEIPIYTWYSTESGAMLLNYIVGDGFFYPLLAWTLTEVSIGVREHALISDLRYTNPVIDLLDISFTTEMSGGVDYIVCNAVGAQVGSGSITMNEGSYRTQLSVGALNSGVYLLTLHPRSATHASSTFRFVKE